MTSRRRRSSKEGRVGGAQWGGGSRSRERKQVVTESKQIVSIDERLKTPDADSSLTFIFTGLWIGQCEDKVRGALWPDTRSFEPGCFSLRAALIKAVMMDCVGFMSANRSFCPPHAELDARFMLAGVRIQSHEWEFMGRKPHVTWVP